MDSCSLRCSIFNLEDAFKRYHNNQAEIPKFKSKNKSRSVYRTNNVTCTYKGHNYNSIAIDMERKVIKLPKLKDIVEDTDKLGYSNHYFALGYEKTIKYDYRKYNKKKIIES